MPEPGPHPPRVEDVMTREPVVVHHDDDPTPLLALFERKDFNAVPVVDTKGRLLGMVNKLTLLRLFRRDSTTRSAASLRVQDIMDTRRVWVEPGDGLGAVVQRMTRYHVRSVPVVVRTGGRRQLVGIVSYSDLRRGTAGAPTGG